MAVAYFQGLFGKRNLDVVNCSRAFLDKLWTKKLDDEAVRKLVERV